ncbi:MAG: hypothetical protein AB2L14_12465 [Candidatus Xenobiia bacterium LiM19]
MSDESCSGILLLDSCVNDISVLRNSDLSPGNTFSGSSRSLETCGGGGGVGTTLTLNNCTIDNCTVNDSLKPAKCGGGVYNGGLSTLTMTNCTICGCSAPKGGGIFNYNGAGSTIYLLNTIIINNQNNNSSTTEDIYINNNGPIRAYY